MSRLSEVRNRTMRRKIRLSKKIRGTTERPRLTVSVSNTRVSAQIIDDSARKTLVSTVVAKGNTMTEMAAGAGADIAKKAKAKKVSKVAFDKNGKQYQQRLKAFADAARNEGLEF